MRICRAATVRSDSRSRLSIIAVAFDVLRRAKELNSPVSEALVYATTRSPVAVAVAATGAGAEPAPE